MPMMALSFHMLIANQFSDLFQSTQDDRPAAAIFCPATKVWA